MLIKQVYWCWNDSGTAIFKTPQKSSDRVIIDTKQRSSALFTQRHSSWKGHQRSKQNKLSITSGSRFYSGCRCTLFHKYLACWMRNFIFILYSYGTSIHAPGCYFLNFKKKKKVLILIIWLFRSLDFLKFYDIH